MLLAILQGFSELFPISSLGHTVLVPALLHWRLDLSDPTFLAFVVVLHLGTALALLVFYWSEWRGIVGAIVRGVVRGRFEGSDDEKVAWLLVVGTIPAGLLGVFFEREVRGLFASPLPVAVFLFLNGLIMFAGERLRRRQHRDEGKPYRSLPSISFVDALGIGAAQALALLPGISRSGSSIVAGLIFGLSEAGAARFSFLLATPIIFAAGLLEVPRLFAPDAHVGAPEAVAGGILAAVTAYFSVAFLTRYFQTNDLRPFGWYCVIAGAACFALFRWG
ncbi:MAG: undecaprenyl-diphosphate phosphatase [Candidatus Eremiobacteraeota bacterium]|nr:undecaprenyl-diphosphate phosphatase [Candidatus Eremiobacteraeota bacterium]